MLEPVVAPKAELNPPVCEKPVLLVANPVVGLNAFPPSANVMRMFVAFAVRPSEEYTLNFATIRLSVALMSTALVLVMFTA